MKISGNEIRFGNIIELHGKLWSVVKTQHVQPGKGGAYMQVELKNIIEGTKTNERFRSSEQVERVHLDEVDLEYLYLNGDFLECMDTKTFEQFSLPIGLLGEKKAYLQDNMKIRVSFHDNVPVSVRIPDTAVLTIKEADPVVKGQTASSSYKPAILENDIRIMVPPHIEAGMRVVVNTELDTYLERAKG